MLQALNFRGRTIKAIAFDGGGTVYPKGVAKTSIHPEISSRLVQAAQKDARLALISVNSSEVDLARVGLPLAQELSARQRESALACYVDGGARLVIYNTAAKSDADYSRPFLISAEEIKMIREATCALLPSRLGLSTEEQTSWIRFYTEKQPTASFPWLAKTLDSYPLEYFPVLNPEEAKAPNFAPWLEKRGEDISPRGENAVLMLAIKPLPRHPRDVREAVINGICKSFPSLSERLRILPGGFGSIDIMHKDAGKKAALEHFLMINKLNMGEVLYLGDELTLNREDSDLLLTQFSEMPKVSVNPPDIPVTKDIPNLFFDPTRTGQEGTIAWLGEIT